MRSFFVLSDAASVFYSVSCLVAHREEVVVLGIGEYGVNTLGLALSLFTLMAMMVQDMLDYSASI